jgi:hypothetical protein
MKFVAQKTNRPLALALVTLGLLLGGWVSAAAQKSCECGEPSQGTVTCEANQEPFCIVRSGKVDARCSSSSGNRGAFQRLVLSEAMGRALTDKEWLNPELQESLKDGKVKIKNAQGKNVWVTFRSEESPYKNLPYERPEPDKPQPLNPSATIKTTTSVQSSSSEPAESCEVCVVTEGLTKCRKVAGENKEKVRATVTSLCGLDYACVKREPKINCDPH